MSQGSPNHPGEQSTAGEQNQNNEYQLALELRESINSSLLNVGVLSALLMALSGAIYVDPAPPPGECFGEPMLQAEMVIVWISMGLFFVATISTVVLHMDIDGVPTNMLLDHLCSGEIIYSLPHIACALGIHDRHSVWN